MNILFICSAKTWGGNEKWVSMAMQGLMQNHQVYFLGKNPELLSKFGSVNHAYSAPFTWNFDVATLKTIDQIVNNNKIDVIVSSKKKEYFLAGLVAKKYQIKHYIRLGIVRDMKIPFWSKLVYHTLNDGIIVNAHQIKNNLLKYPYFSQHPIKVVYNGVSDLDIPLSTASDKGKFTIVSTGMLTRRKGFHILIEAISLWPEELKETIRLRIVGEGREEEKLKQMVEDLNLQKTIFFEGFSLQSTSFLKDAHLFALISGNEGISNAIIEAMYAGVPVLTTKAGGALEFIENKKNGFLTSRNAVEVSHVLKELCLKNRQDLSVVGQNGQATAKAMFNINEMNDQLASFLVKN